MMMRLKELKNYIDGDVKAAIIISDVWEYGNMKELFIKYGNYYVKEILPMWSVIEGVAKLKIAIISPDIKC